MEPRVCYLITRAEPGGAQLHVLYLVQAFRVRFTLCVGLGQGGFFAEEVRKLGVEVHVLKNLVQPIDPLKDVRAFREISALLHHSRPDLLHVHSSKAGMIGRLAAAVLGIPVIFTAHGWAFADGVCWPRKAVTIPSERLAARSSARIIVVSEADRRLALRYRVAPPEKLVTIHNGIPDVASRAAPAQRGDVKVVMVARFAPQKDHLVLLRAIATLDLPCQLLLVGDGPTRASIEQEAHRLGLAGRVTFLGTRTDVAEILAQAHILVLTSKWEGFPLTILEAMRAGLPVVASDVGGVREAVVDGETGFLTPRGHVDALRDRLARLVESPELRARMGHAGRVRYEQHFTVERMLDQTLKVYHDVLAHVR